MARKLLKMTDFSKTGSRNMAETCAINFLTLVSYSTSIVIGGPRRLLLPIRMWAGVDLEYFRAETALWSFRVFFQLWSPTEQKLQERESWFFGTVGKRLTVNSNWMTSSACVEALCHQVVPNMLTFSKFAKVPLPHMHWTSQRHQIFRLPKQLGALWLPSFITFAS